MKKNNRQLNKGLSLAELSIVLVIIGLLLAAVMGGIGIKKSSELRSFLTDISSFQVAIEGFNSKYSDLPGDMHDAYDHWGTSCAASANLCNGDSDSRIEEGAGDDASSNESLGAMDDIESFRLWQHLTLSEFLGGSYTGIATTTFDQADIGINVPAAKRAGVGYTIFYGDFGFGPRNSIFIGKFTSSAMNTNAALTPEEAFSIDKKLDDGNAASGQIKSITGGGGVGLCTGAGWSYNITNKNVACTMMFPLRP